MLKRCWNYSKQGRNNVVTLCCSKNRRWESSRVTSPLGISFLFMNLYSSTKPTCYNNFQCGLTLDNAPWPGDVFLKVLKVSLKFYWSFVFPLVVPEGIIHESSDFTTIILILVAVIILVVLTVSFLIFVRRRRSNKTKGIFCYLLYCIILVSKTVM